MRRFKLRGIFAVLALLFPIVVIIARQYQARPFFAGTFGPVPKLRLMGWESGRALSLEGDLRAYYDYRERVLLVVRVQPDRNVEWFIDDQPLGDWLWIRRQDDNLKKQIEWRRDCIIYLDREGVPIYVSNPVHEFTNAFSSSITIAKGLNDIVQRYKPEQFK